VSRFAGVSMLHVRSDQLIGPAQVFQAHLRSSGAFFLKPNRFQL